MNNASFKALAASLERRKGPPRGVTARAPVLASADRVALAVAQVGEGSAPLDVMNQCGLTPDERREFLRRVELMRRLTL